VYRKNPGPPPANSPHLSKLEREAVVDRARLLREAPEELDEMCNLFYVLRYAPGQFALIPDWCLKRRRGEKVFTSHLAWTAVAWHLRRHPPRRPGAKTIRGRTACHCNGSRGCGPREFYESRSKALPCHLLPPGKLCAKGARADTGYCYNCGPNWGK
jgi:hypothetical protein